MSTSETDSEPELVTDTVSSLSAFVRLSATRPGQGTVGWAVDTLATLDFRLVRKDTALHGLIQDCAGVILALLDNVLQHKAVPDSSCNLITDVASSLLRPSFLHLLFQYRRLFRVIAARNLKPGSPPLAIVCWVDLILAKLGDAVVLIAAGIDGGHTDRSLPESLKAQREEDNLRAALQLPDNWDMLPSMLLSERESAAAKRLSIRLMLGRYILHPSFLGQAGVDTAIYGLLSTLAEFMRQSAVRVDDLRSALGSGSQYLLQQERLTSAMAVSLFATADTIPDSTIDSERAAAFRPQTVAAAMQLLRFVLKGGYLTQMNILSPLDHLDIPTSILVRWSIVPQWTWSTWSQYRSIHADTIICLTTTFIQYQRTCLGTLLGVSDLMSTDSWPGNPSASINVIIDLVFRFVLVLSADRHSKQLPTDVLGVLHGSCELITQWIQRNSCGAQNSTECSKVLIILFGYLCQDEKCFSLNELLIGCLASMKRQCTCSAWEAAMEDNNFCFPEVLGQGFMQIKMGLSLSQDDTPKPSELCAAQLMQFFVVMMSKGVQLSGLDTFIEAVEAVGERVLEAPWNHRGFLCETFLTCLASAKLSGIELPCNTVTVAASEEAIWRLGMCSGDENLFLASAFSLYITSSLVVGVERLTYLEGLEHLLDIALLICSQHYLGEEGPLALVVLPTICDAVAHLLEHRHDDIGVYAPVNTRISALGGALQSLGNREAGMLLKCRVLQKTDGERLGQEGPGREHELVYWRLDGRSHCVYVAVV